jgi:hypothetical protein
MHRIWPFFLKAAHPRQFQAQDQEPQSKQMFQMPHGTLFFAMDGTSSRQKKLMLTRGGLRGPHRRDRKGISLVHHPAGNGLWRRAMLKQKRGTGRGFDEK